MEREIFFSGIGGQGVQLAAKTLAVAALNSGFQVMIFGSYGGLMRGGNTDATIVIGEDALHTPPVVDEAWAALMMHHYSWPIFKPKGMVSQVPRSISTWSIGATGEASASAAASV